MRTLLDRFIEDNLIEDARSPGFYLEEVETLIRKAWRCAQNEASKNPAPSLEELLAQEDED